MPQAKRIDIFPHGTGSEKGTGKTAYSWLTGKPTPSVTGRASVTLMGGNGRAFVQQQVSPIRNVATAGDPISALIGGITGFLGGGGWQGGLAGAAAGWTASQVLGDDNGAAGASPQGNGGRSTAMTTGIQPYGIGGLQIGGWGVPEPADGTWSSKWKIKAFHHVAGEYWVYFWRMWDGWTICYNPRTKGWKRYKVRKNIVLSSDPRISNIARATRATEGKLKRLAKKTRRLTYK